MKEKVLNTILENNLIKDGDRVGVGLSGGSDSMALICCLLDLRERLKIELFAIHINHNLRGEESKRDEHFVLDFCKKNKIKCIVKSVNVEKHAKDKKHTIEQSARELRYQAFCDAVSECGLDAVALAHHKNDQAETILMHIGRGCGINGLIGMRYKQGKYIRPLLNIEKKEIEKYINENHIEFVEDSTNKSDEYKRNYVRHNLLKAFEKAYDGALNSLVKLSSMAQIDEDYIMKSIPFELIKAREDGIVLSENARALHLAVVSRLVRECFVRLGSVVDVEALHIEKILSLFDKSVGKRLDMPNGASVVKCYDGVLFTKNNQKQTEEVPFNVGKFNFCGVCYEVSTHSLKQRNENGLYFDIDKIPPLAVWRNYTSDDKFTKFGGGTKKVKDYLVSKKIDSVMRKSLPCLCNKNECLLIAGVEISDSIKVDEKTKNVGILTKIDK